MAKIESNGLGGLKDHLLLLITEILDLELTTLKNGNQIKIKESELNKEVKIIYEVSQDLVHTIQEKQSKVVKFELELVKEQDLLL